MNLGRVVHVGIDTSFKDIFVVLGFGVFAVGHVSQVDIEECWAGTSVSCQCRGTSREQSSDIHVTKVEETDMSQIDRLGVEHLFRAHGHSDAENQPKSRHPRLTDPRVSIALPTPPIWGCLCTLRLSSLWSSILVERIERVVVLEATVDIRNSVISSC